MSSSRPALVWLPEREQRSTLAAAIERLGFEAVPLKELADLPRFAQVLEPALIAIPSAAGVRAEVRNLTLSSAVVWVLLGDAPDELIEAWPRALFLPITGLTAEDICRRLEVALLGQKIGLLADDSAVELVGSLAQISFLEVVQRLAAAGFTGDLKVERNEILSFVDGKPVAAAAGSVAGVKAFNRLVARQEGTLRIAPGPPSLDRNLLASLDNLIQAAMMDHLVEPLDGRAQLGLGDQIDLDQVELSPLERELFTAAQAKQTVQETLDASIATDGEVARVIRRLVQKRLLILLPPAPKIRIVTDSTADLAPELVRAAGLVVVPLTVTFGKTLFRDRIDLQPRQFYELLAKGEHHPVSSPPTPADFVNCFGELLSRSDVVAIHLSAQLSQTHANAKAAAGEIVRSRHLEVVDSRQVGLALGLLALLATRLAERGLEAPAIGLKLNELAARTRVFFGVDTLEFLVKGGRLSRTRGFFGKMLGIKPILGLENGAIVPLENVRGSRAVEPKLLELAEKSVKRDLPLIVGIMHSNAPERAERLKKHLETRFQLAELIVAELGPVVGTHAGPGTIGLVVLQPTAEELPFLAP